MSYKQILTQISDVTYQMLELAQTGQWNALINRERDRQRLLSELAEHRPDPADEKVSAKLLAEVIEINSIITDLSNSEKMLSLEKYQQSRKSKKATMEYLAC